ncbi:MAG: uroporphyrinogen decarboxylase [Alphaproteobacteria bacterium]
MPDRSAKPFLRVLRGEVGPSPPFWLMRQAGRYLPEYRATRASVGGFLELCYSPEHAVEVTLQPLRRYGMDAAILFSDILVVPDGLGQQVSFREGEGPVLTPLADTAAVTRLDPDRMERHLAPVYETVRRLAAAIPAETALIGFAGAPWTVATYMIEGSGSKDFAGAKAWAFGDGAMSALMECLVEATARHLIAQIDAGAEVVQVFDTWAGVLPEDVFHRLVITPMRTLVERIRRERPGIPVIGFPRGAGVLYEAYVAETGVDGVSIDSSVPLRWAAERLQPHCTVQGNLDPILLASGGPAMVERIHHILDVLGRGPFIFNLGHGIVPRTPPENVALLARTVRGEG